MSQIVHSPLPYPHGLREAGCWVFDLDNTLYHHSAKLFDQIDVLMKAYIARLLDLPEDQAFKVQKQYFRDYGTTLRGLMNRHHIDPHDFLDFVHDIDLSVIDRDTRLEKALAALPGRKIIFTNADEPHADRVMARLGIRDQFEAVFDIFAADFVPKPAPEVYDALIRRHGIAPTDTVMVEDMARNLIPAHALGMTTLWIDTGSDFGRDGHHEDHIHHATDDLSAWLAGVAVV
ncbi:pyrimidine 5'-nucleotidase [Magnetospira sp. QH-2]|uniref:pyrimidine 5'-nucleotidase n=1 Tax=Magnetospira sp. (strain QH-2) TaxID=1288970 RepID=UPI0005FA2A16|nr:pyrimidine 5'-nucleotidase [Magnetospira sp. QH-2]